MSTALIEADALVQSSIDQIGYAAREVVKLMWELRESDKDSDKELEALVNAIIGKDNPMTGKPHSATSAIDAAKKTDTYIAAKDRELACSSALELARAKMEEVKLRARLAVAYAVVGETD